MHDHVVWLRFSDGRTGEVDLRERLRGRVFEPLKDVALLQAFANPPGRPSLGVVLAGDPGFVIERSPDTVRAPDIAFVRRERWPVQNQDRFGEFAPDMAIEIRSPSDATGAVLTKVGQWLSAGVTLVWVIDPQQRIAQQFTADGTIILLGDTDVLDGAPVLSGLKIALSSLWQPR